MTESNKYTDDERAVIFAYAGNAGPAFKSDAIAAHRQFMTRIRQNKSDLPYGDPYFEFMREVDNPAPDLMLRGRYRARIVKGEK